MLKKCAKMSGKKNSKKLEKWDRHLKAFFTNAAFFLFFLVSFVLAFGALWGLLGRLLGFLRVSWEVSGPKNIKNHRVFSGFLKAGVCLFKANDGPLGLILVSLVNLFRILCKKVGPNCVAKLNYKGLKFEVIECNKNIAKKKG